MSHITSMDLIVKESQLDCLERAAKRLGMELVRGKKNFKWYGQFVGDTTPPVGMKPEDFGKCDHALRIKGDARAYEIGLVRRADNKGYDLHWDYWQGGYGLRDKVGYTATDTDKLKDWYTAEVSAKAMRAKGFTTSFVQLTDGVKTVCKK